MGWVSCKERLPELQGFYYVVEYDKGHTPTLTGLFQGRHPSRKVSHVYFSSHLELEADYADRAVYLKYRCFKNGAGQPYPSDEILYWYELDPMPEPSLRMCD